MKSFEKIQIGDELSPITKMETIETIRDYLRLSRADEYVPGNVGERLHVDEEYSKDFVLSGTSNQGVATVGYVSEMLEGSFPLSSLLRGSTLEVKTIAPVRAGDTITIHGKVVDKVVKNDKKSVRCEIYVENQNGVKVAIGTATIVF
ncbi:MAG: MaoC family dehydratase [Thermodesulfobacteriota bacterium]|nr:MaoC family dehydratase [Thermodesulfobacteriota bacterium]